MAPPTSETIGENLRRKDRQVAPAELHERASKSLHFVGYQGLAMIAVSELDMAAWDALAKAAGLPRRVLDAVFRSRDGAKMDRPLRRPGGSPAGPF